MALMDLQRKYHFVKADENTARQKKEEDSRRQIGLQS